MKINTSFPQMQDAIQEWEFNLLTNTRRQTLQDGVVSYQDIYVKMRGVIQPLRPEDLELKPEEQRSWQWFQIHIRAEYEKLKTDQLIWIDKKPYKVKAIKDYSRNGYMEYHIVEHFENK